jgi:hypothetical protein
MGEFVEQLAKSAVLAIGRRVLMIAYAKTARRVKEQASREGLP